MFKPASDAPGAIPSIRIRQGAGAAWLSEILNVVNHAPLSGDGIGVEERLAAVSHLAWPITGEVLIVEEGRASIGTYEVLVLLDRHRRQ